jgi:hypothetical protein
MPPDGTTNIANSPEDLRAKVQLQVVGNKPSFFKLEAQLPMQGRADTPLAASEKMWVVLKTYAADGENGLHAHPNEDHGTFYRFKATSEEPLVMVRIGAAAFDGLERHGRINPDGSESGVTRSRTDRSN